MLGVLDRRAESGDRSVYMHTDLVIEINREHAWNPPLGDYLAYLKDEIKGVPITSYVSVRAKNYVHQLQDCYRSKVSLQTTYKNSMGLNMQSM